jgi:hypothetical protein
MSYAQTRFALTSDQVAFPALQSIKINITGSRSPDPPNAWRALENSPVLRRVSFHNIRHLSTAKLPWIQLTDLFFGDKVAIKPTKCLDILQECPNLESCVFLYIRATSFKSSFCLTLPALRDIHVAYDSGHLQFVSLLERSSCRIERFVIDTELTPRYFIQCFKSMPHLAELDIRAYTSSKYLRNVESTIFWMVPLLFQKITTEAAA